MQQAVDRMQVAAPDDIREEVIYHQVRVLLAQDRLVTAETALEGVGFGFQNGFSYPALETGRNLSHPAGSLYNGALRLLLQQPRSGSGLASVRSGIELADRLIARALESQAMLVALEALLLRSQMHAALEDSDGRPVVRPSASHRDLVRALELAEPEGFASVFVEEGAYVVKVLAELLAQNQLGSLQRGYIEKLLAAFNKSSPAPARPPVARPAALIEPLTDREVDVLRLMAEGLKYAEIAERLFVSLNTVRSHVKAIYGKLNVNNRTQAIEMARQLQIL
jgi:LuxR family maltose regulon positive regulatory protein